jgi:hypothetical protein
MLAFIVFTAALGFLLWAYIHQPVSECEQNTTVKRKIFLCDLWHEQPRLPEPDCIEPIHHENLADRLEALDKFLRGPKPILTY